MLGSLLESGPERFQCDHAVSPKSASSAVFRAVRATFRVFATFDEMSGRESEKTTGN